MYNHNSDVVFIYLQVTMPKRMRKKKKGCCESDLEMEDQKQPLVRIPSYDSSNEEFIVPPPLHRDNEIRANTSSVRQSPGFPQQDPLSGPTPPYMSNVTPPTEERMSAHSREGTTGITRWLQPQDSGQNPQMRVLTVTIAGHLHQ